MQAEDSTILPLISILVVNLDGKQHLECLMSSIAEQTYSADRIEVILVDNGSKDDSLPFIAAHYPATRVIRNATNEGFARPNNCAAEVARGTYLALLNNDMKLDPTWLEYMVRHLETSPPDVACIGSRILNWDGSAVDFIGGTMSFNGMGFQTNFQAPVDSPQGRDYPDELLFACGGAMLIRRDVYLESGGLDEDYFAYFEDVDLGWRLWVLGHRIRFCPEAVVYHRHNGTSSRFDWRKKVVLFERNAMFSVVKNYERASLERIWPAALLLGFKRLAIRSGVAREEYRFGPSAPRPSVEVPPSETRLAKVIKNLRQLGFKMTVKKVLVAIARKILHRWGSQSEENGATVPVLREAYASVVGMEDFIDHLPRVMQKRREIQARRRRSDSEIFRIFGDPLRPIEARGGYDESHYLLAKELGLTELLESAVAPAR